MLSLDLVGRDRLDAAASYVVDLLERPASEIRVLEGQLGLDQALVVPGHPDAYELSAVTPVEPGTVWAVDGGSCTVADGRSFQVAAFRAARVRFEDGQTVDVERPQLDVRAVAPEEMARLARATLTELCRLDRTLNKRAGDILAYFDRPGASNGSSEAINGRLKHLRGSALGLRNLDSYIARCLLETGGFRSRLHPDCAGHLYAVSFIAIC